METYRTEEEQITAIKGFVTDHGSKVLAVIIISIAIVFGVQGYTQKQSAHRTQASAQFNVMAMQIDQDSGLLDKQKQQQLDAAYQALITEYPDTIYAVYANFLQAKLAVTINDLDAAHSYLTWVKENAQNKQMLALANLRSGQLLFSQEKLDEALAIASKPVAPFERQYLSLEGDILVAQGQREQALVAYQKSKVTAENANLAEDQILNLKINSLKPADSSKVVKPVSEESK